ncbi:MAG: serine kinase [Peptococcia bacterium]
MIELKEIVEMVQLQSLNKVEVDLNREIKGCYIGDLLSNVMAHAREGDLWLTVQTHQNVVAVAQLLNLGGIVFVEGHLPQEETIVKAKQEQIPLFSTADSAYILAGQLYKRGLVREKS